MKPKIKCEFRDLGAGHDGYYASVMLLEPHTHGIFNDVGRIVTTSPVLRIDFEQGIIETENTLYVFDNQVLRLKPSRDPRIKESISDIQRILAKLTE